jgi:hypothetical protein
LFANDTRRASLLSFLIPPSAIDEMTRGAEGHGPRAQPGKLKNDIGHEDAHAGEIRSTAKAQEGGTEHELVDRQMRITGKCWSEIRDSLPADLPSGLD